MIAYVIFEVFTKLDWLSPEICASHHRTDTVSCV